MKTADAIREYLAKNLLTPRALDIKLSLPGGLTRILLDGEKIPDSVKFCNIKTLADELNLSIDEIAGRKDFTDLNAAYGEIKLILKKRLDYYHAQVAKIEQLEKFLEEISC